MEENKYLDKAADVRAGDEINTDAIARFVRQHVSGLLGEMRVKQFKGGASNMTYQLDFDNGSFILRCPPAGTKARSAHDMWREYNVMQKLKPAYPYVPDMIAFCRDESIIGREFYIMEKLIGIIPRAELPKGLALNPDQVHKLCTNVIDKMIELHKVDYQAAGLTGLGKGAGYVQRQVSGWTDRYAKAKTDNVPAFARVIKWLTEHMPQDVATCVIHGDFRFDNVVLNADDPTQVIGVLDWEMATLGDPLMDLGNSLAYWVEADDPIQMQLSRRQPTHLSGMMTRDEVVRYYCDAMSYHDIDFTFYRIYGLFRLAVIAQQIYYRFHQGQTDNPVFGSFYVMVQYLNEYCEELLDKVDQ
jgi:aminoglycoside phosphotransferase (APT) family kinase protein